MRITKEHIPDYCIDYSELLGRPQCRVDVDNVLLLLDKVEREKIRILELPKIIRHNGKNYELETVYFSNLYSEYNSYSIKVVIPNLKKVKIPNSAYRVAQMPPTQPPGVEVVVY